MLSIKRSKDWNRAKYERFIKEGRGQGDLSEYKPWLTVQDIPSRGRATRVYGWKTKRIHHFFSDIQTRFFYLLEWEDNVVDIKEHYPLLGLKDLIDCEDLNIDKYQANDGTDYVFTTTFLISIVKNERKYLRAISVKASHELESKGTIERFEIERRYWEKKGIDWGVVTNKEIPIVKAKNIEWLHSALELDMNEVISEDYKKFLCKDFIKRLRQDTDKRIRYVLEEFDLKNSLEIGTGLLMFRYLIMKKVLEVDICKKIDIELPIFKIIKNIVR